MSKAMFLVHDGVINEVLTKRVNFVNTPNDFYLLKGVGESIKKLNESGYKVFVVTNQGGVGLGFMTETDLHNVHKRMEKDLEAFGAYVDDIAYCPDKPHVESRCRKPNPGMILDLADKHGSDLASSYMAGDRDPDILVVKMQARKLCVSEMKKSRKRRRICTSLLCCHLHPG